MIPAMAAGGPVTATSIEQRLAIEHGATQVLADCASLEEAAPRIISLVCTTLGWQCGTCWNYAAEEDTMRFVASWGVALPGVDAFLEFTREVVQSRAPGGLIRRTWLGGRAIWVRDVTKDDTFRRAPVALKAGLRSAFSFPVKAADKVIGVIEFFSREIREPDAELLDCTRYVGDQIGQFCQRASALGEARRREEELARFRAAIDASIDLIYLTDRETMRFLYANEAACRLTGYSLAEFQAMGPHDVFRVDARQVERAFDEAIRAGAGGTVSEATSVAKDGTRTMVEVRRRAVRMGERWIIVTLSHDITQRKLAEQAILRASRLYAALSATNEAVLRAASPEELYQKVCDAAVDGGKFLTTAVLQPDADTAASATFVAVSGRALTSARGLKVSFAADTPEGRGLVGIAFRTGASCVSNDFLSDSRTAPWHAIARSFGIAAGAAIPLMRDGKPGGVLLLFAGEVGAFDGEIVKLLERMAENVAFGQENFDRELQRRKGEARIQYLATHDGLTALPNRTMFSELLNHAIVSAQRYKRKFAVMFIDLDRFKQINDMLGHEAGDKLLIEVAKRLKDCLRASDVVARLGGDEFVVLVEEVGERTQVETVARKILSSLMRPVVLSGQESRVTGSVGICMYPADALDEQSLMKSADMAMYLAKEAGKNAFQFYSKEIRSEVLERLAIERNLRRALELDELSLHYQAKLDLRTGAITGVEALLRWQSPELGTVTPAQLIPVAEETGLIVPIGKWVIKAACAQNVAWQRAGLAPVCVAVNISPRQFTDPDLLDYLAQTLRETGLAPRYLELEVTESMVMHNTERAIKLLTAIKEMGIRLAIDDFGTGYSSLAQLKRFPIDTLKVDRSFIRDVATNAGDRAITEAIIAMGKSLSLTIVAEGVETQEQQTFLEERACDEMQGYYFSRPVVADQFAELLGSHLARAP
jgi:diguanylate cyclase (GGDEF)-like protein/PAS domain S-box-containing protein